MSLIFNTWLSANEDLNEKPYDNDDRSNMVLPYYPITVVGDNFTGHHQINDAKEEKKKRVVVKASNGMYLSTEKPQAIDFYKEQEAYSRDTDDNNNNMFIDVQQQQQPHMVIIGGGGGDSSGGEDVDMELSNNNNNNNKIGGKKRAETWVEEETRWLICMRKEMEGLFNTSKSNKHLWEQISAKMKLKGFDRSPTMCTDKWRNLLKDFKKARGGGGGGGAAASSSCGTTSPNKTSFYKEIDEVLKDRTKKNPHHHHLTPPTPTALAPAAKIDSFMHFAPKGFQDAAPISFGPVQASFRQPRIDHDGPPLVISTPDVIAVAATGLPPWNWRETPGTGGEGQSYAGRVITVKCGDYSRRIGIDGSRDAIKEAIKSVFRLRTKRAFWLEDEDQIVRCIDRDMPLRNYTLNVDEGMAIKVYIYDESDHIRVDTEDRVFYTEDDYREFLGGRGWTCLREFDAYKNIDNMDDLRPGGIYRGVR